MSELPVVWPRLALGHVFKRTKSVGHVQEQLLSLYRDFGVIPKASRDDNHNVASLDLSPYQLVQTGNLVINKMKAWQGSVAISTCNGIVSPAYYVAKMVGKGDGRYFHYLLRSEALAQQYASLSVGVRVGQWDLPWASFSAIKVGIPPKHKQTEIANYLDRQTAAIDALIAKKEELMGVLDRYRQAVITKAVTGPKAGVGPSETHVQLKRIFKERSQKGFFDEDVLAATQHAGVIPKKLLEFKTMESMKENWDTYKLVCQDDFVISLRSFEGGLEHSAYRGVISPAYTVLVPTTKVHPAYFRYALKDKAFVTNLGLHKKGIRDGQSVPWTDLKDDSIWLPTVDAQISIAKFLDERSATILKLIDQCEVQTQGLKKYRASIISAAVTGAYTPQ